MKNNMQKRLTMIILVILFTLTIVGTVSAADNSVHNRTVANISANDSNNISTNFTHQNNQTLPDPQIEHNCVNSTAYSTIQDAINAAQSGDTIWLENGATFYEHLTINKNLIFRIASNGQATIDGSNNGRVIYINSGVIVTLYNLIITNGAADYGGGIYNHGTLNLNNCTLIGNTATYGGGCIYSDGTLNVANCTLNNNNASNGGAIYNQGNLAVNECTFRGNTEVNPGRGGGAIYNAGACTVTSSTFTGNTAKGWGGAILNDGNTLNTLTVTNSTFTGNTANGGSGSGGAICNINSICTVTGSAFTGNIGTQGSGAIDNYVGTCTVTGSAFTGNTAPGSTGGAIGNEAGGICSIKFNQIIGNTASNGDAIYFESGSLNATLNWWGSNIDPTTIPNLIVGSVNASTWLVLIPTANPTTINNGETSTITADLQHDNGILSDPTHPELYYHDPALGHVPDGTPVNFSFQGTPLGTLNSNSAYTNNGAATTTFTANTAGTSHVLAAVDSQTVGPVDIQINPKADISISKEFRDTNGNVITTAHYNDRIVTVIKAHNYGPDAATNVKISDTLPAGLTPLYYSVSYNGGISWNYVGPYSGVWNIANLPSGAEYWIGISTNVTSTGIKTNVATVTHLDQYDPTTPDTASATLSIPAAASIDIEKFFGLAPWAPITTANYHDSVWAFITAKNNGPDTATNVTISDIPTGFTPTGFYLVNYNNGNLSSWIFGDGSYNLLTGIWNISSIANGTTYWLAIQGQITQTGTITNTATETAQDQYNWNGYDSATATLTANTALTSLTVNDITGNKGKTVNLKATLLDTSYNVIAGKTVIFKVNGAIVGSATTDANGIATLPYTINLVGGNYTISAEFVADTQYVGSTSEGTLKVPQSSIYVFTTVSQSNSIVGDTIKITFKLGNNGPDGAENVIFTYVIPNGLKLVDINGDGLYSYDAVTRTITWDIGDVPANTDPYLYVLVKPVDAGTFNINPEVSTITYNPDLSNNVQIAAFNAAKPNVIPKINAASKIKTIPLQHTGLPLAGLILAILAVFSGLVSKRKN